VSERGNLTGGIFLSPGRMSTVKIRSRSLFRTPPSRIGAGRAGFRGELQDFPHFSTARFVGSQLVHRHFAFPIANAALAAQSQM
jgi:hypothetical protein